MITVTLLSLMKNGIIVLDDVDEGVFDSHIVSDGFAIRAELEDDTSVEVACIQRVLDDPGKEEHLILLDSHGNSTNINDSKVDVTIYRELFDEEFVG